MRHIKLMLFLSMLLWTFSGCQTPPKTELEQDPPPTQPEVQNADHADAESDSADIAAEDTQTSFDSYGIYHQGEQLAGPSMEDLGGEFYFAFCPDTAYIFWTASTAPPEVPLSTMYTSYEELPYDSEEFADMGFPELTPQDQTVRKYLLHFGNTVYAVDDELWILRQIGLAKGGVLCVYRLEPEVDDAFAQLFGATYEELCAWEETP